MRAWFHHSTIHLLVLQKLPVKITAPTVQALDASSSLPDDPAPPFYLTPASIRRRAATTADELLHPRLNTEHEHGRISSRSTSEIIRM